MNYIRANLALILLIGAVVFTGIALSFVSQKAHDAQKNVAEKSRDLVAQQWELRALKAEWAYLNRPDRLEELSDASHQMRSPMPSVLVNNLEVSAVIYQTPIPMAKPVKNTMAIELTIPVEDAEKPLNNFSDLLKTIGGKQ